MNRNKNVERSFALAAEKYADYGVEVKRAINDLSKFSISLHCWQGDDVGGFENPEGALGGGLAVTGNHPGKARNARELREDLEQAYRLVPGRHRLNLHAFYAETGGKKVDRDQLSAKHFSDWISWGKQQKLAFDFNPTCFSHPKSSSGFTLSHSDRKIRQFWIEHAIACREIGSVFGRQLGKTCITNIWIPDGWKDTPADLRGPRERLRESLDLIFEKTISPRYNRDSVEPKLFGIGSESYVVGSHEFYLAYALSRKKLLTLDAGHYHPTESIADKISSVLEFLPEILLHVSRGVRWDSDHVVTLTDDLKSIAREIVANGYGGRVHLGLDYFDASINRIAAWVTGMRNLQRALLIALLEPPGIRLAEKEGDLTARLALQEEARALPFGLVWDYFCWKADVPVGRKWIEEARHHEKLVLSKRQ